MGNEISNSYTNTSELLAGRNPRDNMRTPIGGPTPRGGFENTRVLLRRPQDHQVAVVEIVSESGGIFVKSKNKKTPLPLHVTKRIILNFESLQLKVDFFNNREREFEDMVFQFMTRDDLERFSREITQAISNHQQYVKHEEFTEDISRTYLILCETLNIPDENFLWGSLQDHYHERKTIFCVRNYPLTERNSIPLFGALRWNYGISEIDLSRTSVNDEIISNFCEQMQYNTSLRKLSIDGIHFKRMVITFEGAKSISTLLSSSSTRMEHLSLKFSQIGNEGAIIILESLIGNTRMKSIDLSNNKLDDCIAIGLCKSFETRESKLREVVLEGNNLGNPFYRKIKATVDNIDGMTMRLFGNPCFVNEISIHRYRKIKFEEECACIDFKEIRILEDPESEGEDEEDEQQQQLLLGSELDSEKEVKGIWNGLSISVRRIDVSKSMSMTSNLKIEAENLLRIQSHPNLLKFYGLSFHKGQAFILYESAETSLRTFLSQQRNLSLGTKVKMMLQILSCVRYLIKKNARCEINPGSIFVHQQQHDSILNVSQKVSDYGFCGISLCHYCFEKPNEEWFFVAPEVFQANQEKGESKSLVFSLGMIMYEILTQKQPFYELEISSGRERDETLEKIAKNEKFRPKFGLDDQLYSRSEEVIKLEQLIQLCWRNPNERPTLEILFEFFKKNFVQV